MVERTITRSTHVQLASTVSLLVGLWLVWVNFAVGEPVEAFGPWNHGILGITVALISGLRITRPGGWAGLSWVVAVLGGWVIVSPLVFGYTGVTEIVWRDLIAGLILVASGVGAALAGGREGE